MQYDKQQLGEAPPFQPGDRVILDKSFGHGIGGGEYTVQACESALICSSGWLVYIPEWKRGLDSAWFIKSIQ